MPTKTERILSHLPTTFGEPPRAGALRALADAFGGELQQAENTLAAVLCAHWVDHADRGAERIDDLGRLAALYGLAPRNGEEVEAFRAHLKRYIRIFLKGPVTVPGILRVVAEALALPVEERPEEMEFWWKRGDDRLITRLPSGSDAAPRILGMGHAEATGQPARPASVAGSVDLSAGVSLSPSAGLRLAVDGAPAKEITLGGLTRLAEVVTAINRALGMTVARDDGGHLILLSPSQGPSSLLEVEDTDDDAAPMLLGLAPRRYLGQDATAATVTGRPDLSTGADLREERYLRLMIDATTTAEIDCAGADPEHTTLDEIRDAINTALGATVASHDGRHLTLRSPTTGSRSSIAFQQPAAQDATRRLFGAVYTLYSGEEAQPARVEGTRDLSSGVDLSENATIELAIDGAPPQVIECAGADPGRTTLDEVRDAINAALGKTIASHDGRHLRLTTPTRGRASSIWFGYPPGGDAAELLFGIGPRRFTGSDASAAMIKGHEDLSQGVDVSAHYQLRLALDGAEPIDIDLRRQAADPRAATLDELTAAIDEALSTPVATHDDHHLILTSPTIGKGSRLLVEPVTQRIERRFVSRTPILDEASLELLGFLTRHARGTPPTAAEIRGEANLKRGVDLRQHPFLRIGVDGAPPQDIDCRGKRPRATLGDEIARAIDTALGISVARFDGHRLTLRSPSSGPSSRIVLEPPRAEDALGPLGLMPQTRRGQEAAGVRFVSTVTHEGGVDLSTARRIKLGYDEVAPVEIDCAGVNPAATSLSEIVVAINLALDELIATHDGRRLHLTSPRSGSDARIVFELPSQDDATTLLFGISAPRQYRGRDATAAVIKGHRLEETLDLSMQRYLRLQVDRAPFLEIDCAGTAADPSRVTLEEVVTAINETVGAEIATRIDQQLLLTSPGTGSAARLTLEYHVSGDARRRILGEVPKVATGSAAEPAVIEGERPLTDPVDLEGRHLLRLQIDNGPAEDVDVTGPLPAMTLASDIVAAINALFPGCADLTEDGRLRLRSAQRGKDARLSVLPRRYLELVEYPPRAALPSPETVHHGSRWDVVNRGVCAVEATATFGAPRGAAWPALVEPTRGEVLRLRAVVQPGEVVEVSRHPRWGVAARRVRGDERIPLPPDRVVAGPLGAVVVAPSPAATPLTRNRDGQPALTLIDPLTPCGITLRARSALQKERIEITVSQGTPAADVPSLATDGTSVELSGTVRRQGDHWALAGPDDTPLVTLRSGPTIPLEEYANSVVAVSGPLYEGTPRWLRVRQIARLFHVTLAGAGLEERFTNVTLGAVPERADDLARRVEGLPSRLVKANRYHKGALLTLEAGGSRWHYLASHADRFDSARFDHARFAGGGCRETALFDLTRFTADPPEQVETLFGGTDTASGEEAEVALRWSEHLPGAFTVNLPAELPPRFGGRFDTARFGHAPGEAEYYQGVVVEPPDDPQALVSRLNATSTLVEARQVPFVPQGWQAATLPFRRPAALSLGGPDAPARLYLGEADLEGFIEIRARSPGEWGNGITLSARPSGSPAQFDVAVVFAGARFENARMVALGKEPATDPFLPPRVDTLLQPGPVGILQGKAAGIRARVTRDHTENPVDTSEEEAS